MNEKAVTQSARAGSREDIVGSDRQIAHRGDNSNGSAAGRPGADRWHNLIVSNTAIAIGSRMHGHKCEIYISNMRVKLRNNFSCCPDLVVVSGEPSFADANIDVLTNPTLVVDVFSNGTDTSGKTKKLESFLETDSIKECLLIKRDEMRIEHYARQSQKQWIYRIYNERDDVVSLDSINCKISLQEIYAQIKFRQAELSSRAVN